MGKRGPKKKPTALAKLQGFPGKQKKHQEPEPAKPPSKALKPPKWLDATARAEWRRLEPELTRLGLLTVLDLTTFASYCAWFSRASDYQKRLQALRGGGRKVGDVITTGSGAVKPHPLVGMARQASEMATRFAARFGLSPSDRSGFGLPLDPTAPQHDTPDAPKRPARDEFDDFLRENRKKHAPPA